MAMPKSALIFGVSGQDGAYLARLLLDKGYVVFGASRDAERGDFSNLKRLGIFERVALLSTIMADFHSVMDAIKHAQPTEIYNLAGQSSVALSFEQPRESMESIALGTLNILEVLRLTHRDARFYNAGSSECFGDTGGGGANEDTPFRPRSPYAVAKSAAFWEVANYREAYNLFACSGLLFNHESPLRPKRFVTRKVVHAAARIAAGDEARLQLGNLNVRRDWGWAPEYVEAMWLMLQRQNPEEFVISTGESHSLESFVAAAFAHFGLDWRDHVDLDPTLFRRTDIVHSLGDPSKARRDLGWEAKVNMLDIVRNMAEAETNAFNEDA